MWPKILWVVTERTQQRPWQWHISREICICLSRSAKFPYAQCARMTLRIAHAPFHAICSSNCLAHTCHLVRPEVHIWRIAFREGFANAAAATSNATNKYVCMWAICKRKNNDEMKCDVRFTCLHTNCSKSVLHFSLSVFCSCRAPDSRLHNLVHTYIIISMCQMF